jgi:pimeloyl-ACP methyl ester carboxylesterase
MATFVLVHGAWQASWCWSQIAPLLENLGHRSVAVDLPGHGTDRTPLNAITMQHYVDALIRIVEMSDEPPILVGHSMGGLITMVAEARSDALAGLVYVAANIPPDGSSMLALVEQYDPGFPGSFVWASDGRTARITPEGARQFLYHLCPQSTIDEVLPLLTPEPVAPFEAPITTTSACFGPVPRYYVETLQDRAVPLRLQRSIQARVGFNRVFSLDTDHSPFFSAPAGLTSCLDSVASAR